MSLILLQGGWFRVYVGCSFDFLSISTLINLKNRAEKYVKVLSIVLAVSEVLCASLINQVLTFGKTIDINSLKSDYFLKNIHKL